MRKNLLFLAVVCSFLLLSCKKEESKPETLTVGKGLFVLNEGNYTNSTGSLSFYDFSKNSVENNLFYRVNNAPLGDVPQSLMLNNGYLYIVVNNSRDIYKVNATTIQYLSQLGNFTSPRYMLSVSDGKAYVSDLGRAGIWVMDPDNMTHTKFIETGKATEMMVRVGDEVFVSNWSKYYVSAANNTVQVIDCVNDVLVDEIEVAQEPRAMVVDKNNHIWVLCSGSYEAVQDPALFCIDPTSHTVIKRFDFTPGYDYPDGMAIDGEGETLYYLNGGYNNLNMYKMSVDAEQLPDTAFIASEGRWLYNLTVDPENGDIFVTEAQPTSNGKLYRYSSEGNLLGTYGVGIFPSYMLFN